MNENKIESDSGGSMCTSDMISPLTKEVFSQLFDEATATEVLSSDGELTAIADRELKRIKTEPGFHSADPLREAIKETFRTPVSSQSPSCLTPPPPEGLKPWAGEYNFGFSVPQFKKPKEPQFSKALNKLYIGQNKNVTLELSIDWNKLDSIQALWLQAEMVFISPDHQGHVVSVCWQHSHDSQGRLRDPLASHILRLGCEGTEARYVELRETKRKVVQIHPLPRPRPGSSTVPLTLRFTDLGSCPGGINRRETAVVLSILREGVAVGWQVLPVRICTCPKRDMEHDERSEHGGSGERGVKRKSSASEVYYVIAYGKDNFEALHQVGRVLEKNRPGGDLSRWEKDIQKINQET